MRILVIDDEQDIRDTSRVLLEHFGHEVRTAKGGVSAIALAGQWRPDAVLIDLSMPGMDGFLTTRKLRSALTSAPLLVVACSAHLADRMTAQLATAAGCDACLLKPMDWNRLQGMLTEFSRNTL